MGKKERRFIAEEIDDDGKCDNSSGVLSHINAFNEGLSEGLSALRYSVPIAALIIIVMAVLLLRALGC